MKLNNKFRQQGASTALSLLLLLTSGLSATFGQAPHHEEKLKSYDITAHEGDDDIDKIHFASSLNFNAQALPLNALINSPYIELKPALAPEGSRLYFSRSKHPHNTSGEEDHEDIWYSDFDDVADTWSTAVRLPGNLNNDGPNFVCSVSASGDTIFLGNQYLKKGKMRAGVSYSVMGADGKWANPVTIKIKAEYNFSKHANYFVSLQSKVIIQAIERTESMGSRDLYVSFWKGKEATAPVNMGHIINSMDEESSPYLAKDQKTLYFASKGHHGYGGYDIFRTTRLDETWTNWSTPENMGPVVNDDKDDEFFVISHCDRYAFFSRQIDDKNVDLFKVHMADLFAPTARFR
jgi:OmpA-OmpF porin, OOP family